MSDDLALLKLLEEDERRQKYNRLDAYFTDDGENSRDKYRKHIDFMSAGIKYRERCMLAANRIGKCLSANTMIQHPDGSETSVGDLYERNKPFKVNAWDGNKVVEATAVIPIKKPAEKIYRVWMSNGKWFDCAAEHRFLTEFGWLFFSTLQPLLPVLPDSNSECGLLKSFEDVKHCLQTTQDSQFDYQEDHCLYDEQFLLDANISRDAFPLLNDVLRHISALSYLDDWVNKYIYILLQSLCPPSIPCVDLHYGGQCAECEYQKSYSFVVQYLDLFLKVLLQPFVEALVLQLKSVISRNRLLFFPLKHPYGLSNSIICYQSIGVKDIYDFMVPKYKNYIASDVIHHNTVTGGVELTYHLTGTYPHWWTGRRFKNAINAWAAGKTNETTRDIIQLLLMGHRGNYGTGLIPKNKILSYTAKSGISNAISEVRIKHISGGTSVLGFKSYDQGMESFMGTERHVIWLDEEPPIDVYDECLIRTMTVSGLILCTFTPLLGLSDVVLSFLPDGKLPDSPDFEKYTINMTWDDAPHLSQEEKDRMWKTLRPHQRAARSKGVPQLGSGAIYPVNEEDIVVDPFEIPSFWARAYGLDVGWKRTAAIWGALDRESDILYLYSEYYRGEAEAPIHAAGIRGRGDWIPGVIDPAARGRNQKDGTRLMSSYIDLGLHIEMSENAVEGGIDMVLCRLAAGKLKVFKTLQNWLSEYRVYRRDKNGRVVKEGDHLMDATRYLVLSGLKVAGTESYYNRSYEDTPSNDSAFREADDVTGY